MRMTFFSAGRRAFHPNARCRFNASTSSRTRSFSSTPSAARHGRPLRMAVIGSGPAGFYTAYRVMSKIESTKVDMYEALPVPFGLVRFGVAPDHPEVKNCRDKFEEVARSPNFNFIGNVTIGTSSEHSNGAFIPLQSILPHYDAVVFAYGALKDKILSVPGESSLKGIYSAREFVGWYNGLPSHADLAPDLTQGDEAVIIGQGNVALDVARMLLEDVDILRKTDITVNATETLSKSRVKRVHIVGRRGPMQAAFTIKEVRELMKLPRVAFHPVERSLIPDDLKSLPRASRRLQEVLVKGSTTRIDDAARWWSLDFCLSPTEFAASSSDASRVGSTVFERTTLSSKYEQTAYAQGTGDVLQIPSSLVFRSIGYKSVALPGFEETGILFNDKRGTIENDGQGRVMREHRSKDAMMSYRRFPGLYCAGWVKRGPTGVIASTMEDAFATGDVIAADWASSAPFLDESAPGARHGWDGVSAEAQGASISRALTWYDWQRIDKAERERGSSRGKEREKFTSTSEMLEVVG